MTETGTCNLYLTVFGEHACYVVAPNMQQAAMALISKLDLPGGSDVQVQLIGGRDGKIPLMVHESALVGRRVDAIAGSAKMVGKMRSH